MGQKLPCSQCPGACKSHALQQGEGQSSLMTLCCKAWFHMDLIGRERQYQANAVMRLGAWRISGDPQVMLGDTGLVDTSVMWF